MFAFLTRISFAARVLLIQIVGRLWRFSERMETGGVKVTDPPTQHLIRGELKSFGSCSK
jgi:hypothetical protein